MELSKYYVSCIGSLCATLSAEKIGQPPIVFIITGMIVYTDGTLSKHFHLEQIL